MMLVLIIGIVLEIAVAVAPVIDLALDEWRPDHPP